MKRILLILLTFVSISIAPQSTNAHIGKVLKGVTKRVTKRMERETTRNLRRAQVGKVGKVVKQPSRPVGPAVVTKSKAEITSRVAAIGGIRIARQLTSNGQLVTDRNGNRFRLFPCPTCSRTGYTYNGTYYQLCGTCAGKGYCASRMIK